MPALGCHFTSFFCLMKKKTCILFSPLLVWIFLLFAAKNIPNLYTCSNVLSLIQVSLCMEFTLFFCVKLTLSGGINPY